jgi:hypothetical protein
LEEESRPESSAIPGKSVHGGCPADGRSHNGRLAQENSYAMAQENITEELEEGED